jgi:hypothetical protein
MAYTEPVDRTLAELITPSIWNAEVAANFRATWRLIAHKTVDESRASTTVSADDAALFAPVLANEAWSLRFVVLVTGSTTADVRFRFTFPGGVFSCSGVWMDSAGNVNARSFSSTTSPTGENDFYVLSTTNPIVHTFDVTYANSGAGGNVMLQWAQFVSSGTATVVKANAQVWGCRLSP